MGHRYGWTVQLELRGCTGRGLESLEVRKCVTLGEVCMGGRIIWAGEKSQFRPGTRQRVKRVNDKSKIVYFYSNGQKSTVGLFTPGVNTCLNSATQNPVNILSIRATLAIHLWAMYCIRKRTDGAIPRDWKNKLCERQLKEMRSGDLTRPRVEEARVHLFNLAGRCVGFDSPVTGSPFTTGTRVNKVQCIMKTEMLWCHNDIIRTLTTDQLDLGHVKLQVFVQSNNLGGGGGGVNFYAIYKISQTVVIFLCWFNILSCFYRIITQYKRKTFKELLASAGFHKHAALSLSVNGCRYACIYEFVSLLRAASFPITCLGSSPGKLYRSLT